MGGGLTPQEVTLEEALVLLRAKAERMRARGKDPYAVRGGEDGGVGKCGWGGGGGSGDAMRRFFPT